ncbi:MAG: YhdP family protein, partial [Aquabacterium sp.]
LGQRAHGETPVAVTVTVPDAGPGRGQPEVIVTSGLQGLALDLPAPLQKPAAAVWPLRVVHRADDPAALSDAITVDIGGAVPLAGGAPSLHVDLRRDVSGARAMVRRGVMSLQQPGAAQMPLPGLPTKGITAQAQLGALDVDAWQAAWADTEPGAQPSGVGQPPPWSPLAGAPPTRDDSALDDYLPDVLALRAGALSWQGRTLRDLQATLTHPEPGLWRAQIASRQAAGLLEWFGDASSRSSAIRAGRLVARLSRLSVPEAEAEVLTAQASARLLERTPATSVPALDILIDDFEWRGVPLGRIEVQAVNRPSTQPGRTGLPEWRLDTFRISNPDAELRANGQWTAVPGGTTRPRSAFDFQLDLRNSGALLARLGQPQTVRGGRGTLSGQIQWSGSPLEPDPPSMSGDVAVQIAEGQFLKADPGIAKLLGVLSLQSLPRRLTLDFRDVFQRGFAFDRIDGQVAIDRGVARTRALRMRGVQALVLMEGQADLARETQDLYVYVLPDLNAGGASLAYAAINPVVGLGTFLAQVLLRKQVSDASSQAFHVTGSWAQPQVTRVPFHAEAAEAAAGSVAPQVLAPPAPPGPAASDTAPRKPS